MFLSFVVKETSSLVFHLRLSAEVIKTKYLGLFFFLYFHSVDFLMIGYGLEAAAGLNRVDEFGHGQTGTADRDLTRKVSLRDLGRAGLRVTGRAVLGLAWRILIWEGE